MLFFTRPCFTLVPQNQILFHLKGRVRCPQSKRLSLWDTIVISPLNDSYLLKRLHTANRYIKLRIKIYIYIYIYILVIPNMKILNLNIIWYKLVMWGKNEGELIGLVRKGACYITCMFFSPTSCCHLFSWQQPHVMGAREGWAHGPNSEVKLKFGIATAGGNHLLVAGMQVTFDVGPQPSLGWHPHTDSIHPNVVQI